ncbi:MAG: hypothetical protein JF617_18670, partial [Burkholderiales bacterium]|nr:hypothetical protein [Burkholderiales bacterium]
MKYFFAAVFLCATVNTVQACSCARAEPSDPAVRRSWLTADAVVLAEAMAIEKVYSIDDQRVDRAEFEARFLSPAVQT